MELHGKKRLILYFDGTRNDGGTNTNILRLYKATVHGKGSDGVEQECEYWEGVGVKPGEVIGGSTFGRGMSKNIEEGYRWLAERYTAGDEVFILGFSRGAFTAMGLIGFLAWRGLPKNRAQLDSKQEFNQYFDATRVSQESEKDQLPENISIEELAALPEEKMARLSKANEDLLKNYQRVRIKFVGLFDTVRAAGLEVFDWWGPRLPPEVPPGTNPHAAGTLALRYTRHLPPNVERARHALAVDEYRAVYHPRVWIVPKGKEQIKNVEQRWFIGAHASVGGGYEQHPLDRIPGHWIQEEARATGIRFDPDKEIKEPSEPVHISVKLPNSRAGFLFGFYRLVSWRQFYRPIFAWDENQGDIVYEKQTIDKTVFERYKGDPSYRPRNFETWLRRQDALGNERDNPIVQCLEKLRSRESLVRRMLYWIGVRPKA